LSARATDAVQDLGHRPFIPSWEQIVSAKSGVNIGSSLIGFGLIVVVVVAIYGLTVPRFEMAGSNAKSGQTAAVAERIKPVGAVTLAGAAVAPAATAAPAAAAGAGKTGEEVYNSACFVCHGSGVAGAPKLGDAAAWQPRIAQGIPALLTSAINGKGAMPPRGTCAACSDAELRGAIEFMVGKAQ
jgi:cytochrome c5